MILSFFQNTQAIEITTASSGGRDEWGHPITSETTEVVQGLVAHGTTNLDTDTSNLIKSSDAKVYLPATTEIKASSKITVSGEEYVIEGVPQVISSPFLGSFIPETLVVNLKLAKYVD